MSNKFFPIMSKPGIQRDGSQYASDNYTDGQWVRFQRGLPRKIGGYKRIIGGLPNIVRTTFVQPNDVNLDVYVGDFESLKFIQLDQFGVPVSGLIDRTPAAYVSDPRNTWELDTMFVATSNTTDLFAHASPNLLDISSGVETPVYYGDISTSTPLVPTGQVTSGGIVSLAPYLFLYGLNGTIKITQPNDPTTLLTTVRVTSLDFVAGKQVRGGNSSPAGLFWSLDSVIRATQAGSNSTVDFRFDTLTDETSILSANCVIEFDSRYFWVGVDKFFIYNGVVQELPNSQSTNFFFDNLNYQYRNKVWATKVPRYNEIWWFYPSGDSTECNEAIIFNVKEGTWYDTSHDRASGYYPQVFNRPIWADNVADEDGEYALWIQETGYDQDIDGNLTAIDSYFETRVISNVSTGPEGNWTGVDRWVNLVSVEPDFRDLVGTMTLVVNGREYSQGTLTSSAPYSFTQTTDKIDMNGSGEQRRFMTLKFESNEVGGTYQAGAILLEIGLGDARK